MPTVNGTAGDDNLTGTEADDVLYGFEGNDTLDGLGGNDILDGGTGADRMTGGAGDDTYYVDDGADEVIDTEGTNTLIASVSFHLPGNDVSYLATRIAYLRAAAGTADIDLSGNHNSEQIFGNDGNNVLNGRRGADTIHGGGGNDVLIGFDDGFINQDRLYGGTGDDVYHVDQYDLPFENSGEGEDTVLFHRASGPTDGTYTLPTGAHVEHLAFFAPTLTSPHNLVGNELANSITGNDGSNGLLGGGGDDVIRGRNGDDRLYGEAGNDHLSGEDGNDVLTGGDGNDVLAGGAGDDTYHINSDSDEIVEEADGGVDLVRTTVSFTMTGSFLENALAEGAGSVDLVGNELANVLTGNSAGNRLVGAGGDDILNGGLGGDELEGGAGNDLFHVDSEADVVTELFGEGTDRVTASVSYRLSLDSEVELLGTATPYTLQDIDLAGSDTGQEITGTNGRNILEGKGGDDVLLGFSGDDRLSGGTGNDLLDGMHGADRHEGGQGNDVYRIDDAADLVVEFAAEGDDRIISSASYVLAAGVSVETLGTDNPTGTSAINLTGNELAQSIYGNDGHNVLTGGGGADYLVGRIGNDTYNVYSQATFIRELDGEGDDRLLTANSFALAPGVSIELLATAYPQGTEAIALAGNEFGQSIYGNAGDNALNGEGGIDYLVGGGGNDTLIGGEGADHMRGGIGNDVYHIDNALDALYEVADEGDDAAYTSVSYSLQTGVSIETLIATGTAPVNLAGNEIGNSLYGNAGNNILNGGGGIDYMVGRFGNDSYHVDHAGDVLREAADEGDDSVLSNVSYTLAEGVSVETLIAAAGTAALNLTGNGIGQSLYGNDGANVLNGRGGADYLIGRGGADEFLFDTALGNGNVDGIADFQVAVDRILLDNSVFEGLAEGRLDAAAFALGSSANDADDRIIYDSATGALFYDPDGTGSIEAIQFARVTPGLRIENADFLVI